MTQRHVLAACRAAFGVLELAALAAQFRVTLTHHFSIVNFFSYFTNLSNLAAAMILIVGSGRLLRGAPDTQLWTTLRFVSAVNMVFVGLVFNTLLAGLDVGALLPWVNVVLHMLLPVVVLLDWIAQPPSRRLPWNIAAVGLVFPAIYSMYSLIRGPLTGFYPYPFYNASAVGGVGLLILGLLALTVALSVLALLLVWIARRRAPVSVTAPEQAATAL